MQNEQRICINTVPRKIAMTSKHTLHIFSSEGNSDVIPIIITVCSYLNEQRKRTQKEHMVYNSIHINSAKYKIAQRDRKQICWCLGIGKSRKGKEKKLWKGIRNWEGTICSLLNCGDALLIMMYLHLKTFPTEYP